MYPCPHAAERSCILQTAFNNLEKYEDTARFTYKLRKTNKIIDAVLSSVFLKHIKIAQLFLYQWLSHGKKLVILVFPFPILLKYLSLCNTSFIFKTPTIIYWNKWYQAIVTLRLQWVLRLQWDDTAQRPPCSPKLTHVPVDLPVFMQVFQSF